MNAIYFLALFLLMGCGIGKTMDGIRAEIGTMKDSVSSLSRTLGDTGSAIKSQGVAMALGECMKPENLQFVQLGSVIPASLIPCAQAFGEMASAEQIAGLAYLWFIDLNQGLVDAVTEDDRRASDLFKLRRLMVLETIAGMLSEEKTRAVYGLRGGQYGSSVVGLMALRYQFVSTFLLEVGVLAKDHPNEAEIGEGFKSIKVLRTLEAMEGSEGLQVRLLGFFSPELNQVIAVEKKADELEKQLKQKGEHNVRAIAEFADI
jgi:hypothetical protein